MAVRAGVFAVCANAEACFHCAQPGHDEGDEASGLALEEVSELWDAFGGISKVGNPFKEGKASMFLSVPYPFCSSSGTSSESIPKQCGEWAVFEEKDE